MLRLHLDLAWWVREARMQLEASAFLIKFTIIWTDKIRKKRSKWKGNKKRIGFYQDQELALIPLDHCNHTNQHHISSGVTLRTPIRRLLRVMRNLWISIKTIRKWMRFRSSICLHHSSNPLIKDLVLRDPSRILYSQVKVQVRWHFQPKQRRYSKEVSLKCLLDNHWAL